MLQRTLPLPDRYDLARTVRGLQRGSYDPTCRFDGQGFWRASRSPGGPATVRVTEEDDRFHITAWGDGAEAALAAAEDLLGLNDDVDSFDPGDGLIARLWHQFGGVRLTRSHAVSETVIASVLEQRVTTFEARRSHRQLVQRWGDPAPGPADLHLPPDPEILAGLAYYDLHELGVEKNRADTIRRLSANARSLDALVGRPLTEAYDRLLAFVGVGPWTAAYTAMIALGDPDAVPIGDVHLPSDVTYALTGTAVDDDDAMVEALEPFAGHRGRVIGLIGAAGLHAPKRAPRYSPRDIRRS